jgi:manganese/iron transport system permease protein
MVASLAWGFLAREIYRSIRHLEPVGFDDFLFGQMSHLTPGYAMSVVMLSAAVVLIVASLGKEILYYCFDPVMARASGIRVGFIHYLMLLMVTLTIVLGIRIAGSVLVTALLVLPGATALMMSQNLRTVFTVAITTAAIAASGGVIVHQRLAFVPAGPAMVLVLFGEFLLCWLGKQIVLPLAASRIDTP